MGFLVFVVTNQGGIAKGYYNEAQMHRFHWKLKFELSKSSAWIDDFAFCPHYPYPPNHPKICSCRKPSPKLILQLSKRWNIKTSNILMIGDKQTDVDAAENADCSGFLFRGDNIYEFSKSVIPDLL